MPKTYRVIDPATLDPRGGPRQLVRKADAAGFVVEVRRSRKGDLTVVGGISAEHGLAFEARWLEGLSGTGKRTMSASAILYDEVERGYREVEAPVRVKVGKSSATRETGYVDGVRLVYLGGPRGISIGIDALKGRMAAL